MAGITESPADCGYAEADGRLIERVGFGLPDRGFVVLRLRAMDGSRIIEVYQPEVIIGRHSQTDIRIASPDVSRHHCRLVFESSQWHVEDLGSLNGTYVNGERVQRAVLPPGAILRVANHAFVADWPQLDSTVDCPHNPPLSSEIVSERARQILASIAEQLPE